MGLYFLESMKETGNPRNRYKDQIYIIVEKTNVLNLIGNIIKLVKESNDDEKTIYIGFAGELTE